MIIRRRIVCKIWICNIQTKILIVILDDLKIIKVLVCHFEIMQTWWAIEFILCFEFWGWCCDQVDLMKTFMICYWWFHRRLIYHSFLAFLRFLNYFSSCITSFSVFSESCGINFLNFIQISSGLFTIKYLF